MRFLSIPNRIIQSTNMMHTETRLKMIELSIRKLSDFGSITSKFLGTTA